MSYCTFKWITNKNRPLNYNKLIFVVAGHTKVMGTSQGNRSRLMAMLLMTFVFFLVEIVVGYLTNSMALVADSFHMLSDVAALVVAFVSVKVSSKQRVDYELGYDANNVSPIMSDVPQEMVKKHLWLGKSRSTRSTSQRSVFGRFVFLHSG